MMLANNGSLQLQIYFCCGSDAPICDSVELIFSACNKQNSSHFSLIFILTEMRAVNLSVSMSPSFGSFLNIAACCLMLVSNIEPTVSLRCLGVKGIIPAYLANKKQTKMAHNLEG